MKYCITFDTEKYHLHREIENWCKTNINHRDYDIEFKMFGHIRYYFNHKKDYLMFILKWG